MSQHRESPVRRVNPSGKAVFVARYTAPDGKRRSAGSYKLKRDAQEAINRAYGQRMAPETVGAYAAIWLRHHPRTQRTEDCYQHRLDRALDVMVESMPLRDHDLTSLRRRHAYELVNCLLVDQGRAVTGAVGVLRVLSAMFEDAITDELAEANPFRGVRVRASDPRARKAPRELRVFSFEDMHRLARAAGQQEAMIRVLSDCGLRLGEMLALERRDIDGDVLHVRRTTYKGCVSDGTKTDHGMSAAGRRVPIPTGLLDVLRLRPPRIDSPLLFPNSAGRVRLARNWYRDVLVPAQKRSGVDALPHELRHSYVSHMRAAGVDPADLADITGHTVATATKHYTHALRRSYEAIKEAVG